MAKQLDLVKALYTEIKNRKFKGIYFFCGDEPYYIDEFTNLIENSVLDQAERDFNQSVLYGSDVDIKQVISYASEYPMMSEYKVVVVREAQLISDFTRNLDLLSDFVANMPPTSILVFAYKYKKLDKRKAIYKEISKKGVYFESAKLFESDLFAWVNARFAAKRIKIDPNASRMLVEFIGNDLSTLSNQVNKLINLSNGEVISPSLVEEHIGISKEYNNFELTSAIANKDLLKANKIVNYFAKNPKDNPIVLTVSTLFSYFTKVILIHSLGSAASRQQIASSLGINPFFVNEYIAASKNYDLKKAVRIISHLRTADMQSKGVGASQLDQGDILKELLFKILH